MDLRRAFQKFSTLELQRWDSVTDTYVGTGLFGTLQVYDRFISDRDFGQKKRIFLTPQQFEIDRDKLLLKIDGTPGVWLMEGVNYDADTSGTYASSVVLREARNRLRLVKAGGGSIKRASGVGYANKEEVVTALTYGDFSRYSSEGSRDLEDVDYTIGSWYLPQGTPIDLDTIIESDKGERFKVKEISSFLDLLMVRVQELEKELAA